MSLPNYFDSSENGAPVINNVAGSLVAALIAIGVTGINVKSVTQIVVTGGVAVATCPAHGYSNAYGKLIRVAGAPVPALNGDFRPSNVLTNSFEYAAPGVADGVYDTGGMSARRAPLGWEVAYINGDSTVAILRRTAVESTAQLLRIVDTGTAPASAIAARVFGVESASGIDTYTGQFPTQTQVADGLTWFKGANNATAKKWAIVGNDRFIHVVTQSGSNTSRFQWGWFGDLSSFKSVDAYQCAIGGAPQATESTTVAHSPTYTRSISAAVAAGALYLARASSQIGSAVPAHLVAGQIDNSVLGALGPVPLGPVDGGCVIQRPCLVAEQDATNSNPIRGILPGLAAPLAARPYTELQVVEGLTGDPASFFAVHTLHGASGGCALIDLTGPWY
jgi:hypothetical protein